ncbi:MarR family winged helix-turn-helix transcriptional regulator [Fervidibacillus albus]|uniref:MarR family transcriptional regulator n=1 Tax=Fervidibacillus albus TaxID=2980026 RepID=A0A9E8LTP9_9BACI|nr:MarR family transcriptional regulator [Fervidibacillus albus]WAA09351.1 MarR family transcriptional regulator [Fervidibacillus albus]
MTVKDERDRESSLKLFVVMSRAMQTIQKRVESNIKSFGMNLTEFAVLELLYHKGEQPIQKIGQKVLLASSSITYVVDKLEKKGHLVRKPCPNDRRVIYAVLTEEGKKMMEKIFPKHQDAMIEIMGGLSTEEKELTIEKLKKLGFYAKGNE